MSATSPIFGIPCSSCKEFLAPPILSSNTCPHSFHKMCFEGLSNEESQCNLCDVKFTVGVENPKLEQATQEMDEIARRILGDLENSSDPLGRLFFEAIQEGEIDVVASLYPFLGDRLVEGISPLYHACKKGQVEIARLLLNNGATASEKNDLNARGKTDPYWKLNDHESAPGATPLNGAIDARSRELVELLLESGAPLEEKDFDGRTPLFQAVHSKNEELALFFIEKGANISIEDQLGCTLLRMAVRSGQLSVIKELVARGADLREKDEMGLGLIYEAAAKNNSEVLAYLLETDAKKGINPPAHSTTSPLKIAVRQGYQDNIKLLVEAGADLSLKYEGRDILQFLREEIREMVNFYKTRPEDQTKGEEALSKMKEIEAFLIEAMGKSCT